MLCLTTGVMSARKRPAGRADQGRLVEVKRTHGGRRGTPLRAGAVMERPYAPGP